LYLLRRCLALDAADRRLLLRAWLALGAIDVALRVHGFRRVVERIRPASTQAVQGRELERAYRYAHWLEVASRYHIVRARCLHRSLALHHWLRQEGVPSRLQIGVQKENQALRAHAWVEVGRHVVSDAAPPTGAFVPLCDRLARHTGENGDAASGLLGPAVGTGV
jgi:hypothetical protein